MLKLLAILRTLFLVFIVVYTIREMTWTFDLPVDTTAAYNVCRTGLTGLRKAAWIAIAWIAFETAIGWWLAARASKAERARLGVEPKGGGEPPFAPPGHR